MRTCPKICPSDVHPIFFGIVAKGNLTLEKPGEFKQHVAKLKGEVQLTITRRKKIRRDAENNYYWGVIVAMVSDERASLPMRLTTISRVSS